VVLPSTATLFLLTAAFLTLPVTVFLFSVVRWGSTFKYMNFAMKLEVFGTGKSSTDLDSTCPKNSSWSHADAECGGVMSSLMGGLGTRKARIRILGSDALIWKNCKTPKRD
jgi:hypothetical protein